MPVMMPVLGICNMPIEENGTNTNQIQGENETRQNSIRIKSNQIPQIPSIGVHNMPFLENRTKQNGT